MAQSTVDQELKKIFRAFAKFRNNLKRADLDFTVQVSISSPDPKTVVYAAQTTQPANGLAPIRVIAYSADELIEKIKVASKNIDQRALEIAYHKEQMASCDRTKLGHQERIEELEAEATEENEDTQDTGEQE